MTMGLCVISSPVLVLPAAGIDFGLGVGNRSALPLCSPRCNRASGNKISSVTEHEIGAEIESA